MIILFSVFCKDVGNLCKWLMFWPKGLHQSQILHADNNTTIIHDINRVYIDVIGSVCSVINYGRGFGWKGKQSTWTKQRRFLN